MRGAISLGQRAPLRERDRHVAALLAMTNRVRMSKRRRLPAFSSVKGSGDGALVHLVVGHTQQFP